MAALPGVVDPLLYERAACRDADPQEFFPVSERAWAEAARVIRRHCTQCPVINRCRRQAQVNHEQGVWGGQYRTQQSDGRRRAYNLGELEAGPRGETA